MLILGHRGFPSVGYPENTLVAFKAAIQAGVHGIECDLRLSHDGVPVTFHDASLARIGHDRHRLKDLTLEALQALSLGGGHTIPALHDLTSSIPAPLVLDFEIKDKRALLPLLAKLKTSRGLRERSIISSFSLKDLLHVKRELPDVRTLLLCRNWPLPLRARGFWRRALEAELWAVGFRSGSLNLRRIRTVHHKGLMIAAWDERLRPEEARRILGWPVDVAIVSCLPSDRA